MKIETAEDRERYKGMIGQRVIKKSKKPFKSQLAINTVKAADIIHPVTHVMCFTFVEDDSYVECHRCISITS